MFHQLDVKKLLKPEVLSDINDAYKASYAATTAYVRASQEVADAARILMEAKSQDYTPELKESYQQSDDINEEMEQIKEKLQIALVKEQTQDQKDCIFPYYPTAFVIAKDVTIKITYGIYTCFGRH